MSYILRTWGCLNPDCGEEFDSGEPAPECPHCRCSKTCWVPGGGHMKCGRTVHADNTLRQTAENFKLTDLQSARQGECAAPPVRQGRAAGNQMYHGIPWSTTPTAGFAAGQPTSTVTQPVGARMKRAPGGRTVPTQVTHVDPRKISL